MRRKIINLLTKIFSTFKGVWFMFYTFEELVFLFFGAGFFMIVFCMICESVRVKNIKWFLASIIPTILGVIMVS